MNEKLFLRNPEQTELGKKIIQHAIRLIHKNGFDRTRRGSRVGCGRGSCVGSCERGEQGFHGWGLGAGREPRIHRFHRKGGFFEEL